LASHARHHPVENREGRIGGRAQPFPRLGTVADERGLVLPALQRPGENLTGDAIIFGDDDPHEA
jgi:hypothetical protein